MFNNSREELNFSHTIQNENCSFNDDFYFSPLIEHCFIIIGPPVISFYTIII